MKGSEPAYQFGLYQIDSEQVVLLRGGVLLAVAPKLVETPLALVEARGGMVTKDHLMGRLWPDAFVEESNLARNIYLLRKALGKRPEGWAYIETVSRRAIGILPMISHGRRVATTSPFMSLSHKGRLYPPAFAHTSKPMYARPALYTRQCRRNSRWI